jgi:DOPA 4,5-dioxygenase
MPALSEFFCFLQASRILELKLKNSNIDMVADRPHPPFDNCILEWHFHVYFKQANKDSTYQAIALREKVLQLASTSSPRIYAIPLKTVNYQPMGPHLIGSYEIWVPIESFADFYQWIVLNRGELSVLLHPLTRFEVKDHTERAVWFGDKLPLDTSVLSPELPVVPFQYPELKLGYSKYMNQSNDEILLKILAEHKI